MIAASAKLRVVIHLYQFEQIPDKDTAEDALDLALDLIVQSGLKGLSLRSLAQKAGISASLLNYRYGSRDALARQALTKACARSADAWTGRTATFLAEDITPADLPAIFDAIVLETVVSGHREAMAAWICQAKAVRYGLYQDIASQWHADCTAFWKAILARAGLADELAPGVCAVLIGACRIGLITRPTPAASAWLHDVVQRISDRLLRRPAQRPGDSLWRAQIERNLLADQPAAPPDSTSTPDRIIDAAAALISESGPDALTHRAIAERAGVSLSSTTHHFRSLEEILLNTFRAIYDRLCQETIEATRPAGKMSIAKLLDSLSMRIDADTSDRERRVMAMDEIILAAARRPETQPIAAGLFATMGTTSTSLIASLEGKRVETDRLDGQIVRFLLTGLQEQMAVSGGKYDIPWYCREVTRTIEHFYY